MASRRRNSEARNTPQPPSGSRRLSRRRAIDPWYRRLALAGQGSDRRLAGPYDPPACRTDARPLPCPRRLVSCRYSFARRPPRRDSSALPGVRISSRKPISTAFATNADRAAVRLARSERSRLATNADSVARRIEAFIDAPTGCRSGSKTAGSWRAWRSSPRAYLSRVTAADHRLPRISCRPPLPRSCRRARLSRHGMREVGRPRHRAGSCSIVIASVPAMPATDADHLLQGDGGPDTRRGLPSCISESFRSETRRNGRSAQPTIWRLRGGRRGSSILEIDGRTRDALSGSASILAAGARTPVRRSRPRFSGNCRCLRPSRRRSFKRRADLPRAGF